MEYVLIPGNVYIGVPKRIRHAQKSWSPPSSRLVRHFVYAMATVSIQVSGQPQRLVTNTTDVHPKSQVPIQQQGFHFLQTCKQAYNEGHYMFYAMNIFHLPPGPINNTDAWYTTLRPEHRKMIKTIWIDLDPVDLISEGTDDIEASARGRSRLAWGPTDDNDFMRYGEEARNRIEFEMWTKILDLYRCSRSQSMCAFLGLERVIVQSPFDHCVLSSRFGTDENEVMSLRRLVSELSTYVEDIVQDHVIRRGWRKTKKWLERLISKRHKA